jgi:hypothetical protein
MTSKRELKPKNNKEKSQEEYRATKKYRKKEA